MKTNSRETALGGLLAIVQDEDMITIDIPNKRIHLHLSDEEIKERLSKWRRPEPKFKNGYLSIYAKLAESAAKGGIIKKD
ncbi:MAG: ilvD 2 [Peptococcaceae bacterium]|jgi:dihydroxy-acid dehydratase|nr:ilvD 2 [Peptococcaceae bacterium]